MIRFGCYHGCVKMLKVFAKPIDGQLSVQLRIGYLAHETYLEQSTCDLQMHKCINAKNHQLKMLNFTLPGKIRKLKGTPLRKHSVFVESNPNDK